MNMAYWGFQLLLVRLQIKLKLEWEWSVIYVSQKYGTLYASFEQESSGQGNLKIVSTKILPTFLTTIRGPNNWGPDLFLRKHVPCDLSLNSSKQDKHFESSNRLIVHRDISEWENFKCFPTLMGVTVPKFKKSVLVSEKLVIRKFA